MAEKKSYPVFLDNGQYTKHGLEKYEWIFGETFLSTGGLTTTVQVLKHVKLPPYSEVLDVGSGLGGHSFLFAERFGAQVLGLDLSENMLSIARRHLENRPHIKDKVRFEFQDFRKVEFPENTFDLIYARDALMHMPDKAHLFRKIYKFLKPNGCVLFTDYVRGEDEIKYSEEFRKYLKDRGYKFATIPEYKQILMNNGFINIRVEDWTDKFKEALEIELDKLQGRKEEFRQNFSEEDYEDLETGWFKKLQRINDDNQGWVLGYGMKR